MEPMSATFITFGVILFIASWIQLLIVSFKEDFTWGLATIFVPPISYFYSLFELNKAGSVIVLSFIGSVLIAIGLM